MRHLELASASSKDTSRAGQEKTVGSSVAFALMAMAREPFVILDRRLKVVAASRSYYKLFPIKTAAHEGRLVCEPSSLEWDAKFLKPLQDVALLGEGVDDFEVELDVPNLGKRSMLLNVRLAVDHASPDSAMLVGLEDVTESRDMRRQHEEGERLQATLLMEVHNRVANSLQLIASIVSIKVVKSGSRETQIAIQDVLNRLTVVTKLEKRLCAVGSLDKILFAPYLADICADLAGSLLAGDQLVAIISSCDRGMVKSDDAASLGMIVTELVTNSLKHAFPDGRGGRISIDFSRNEDDWRLSVADDGVGHCDAKSETTRGGIGASIVQALAQHLKARVEIRNGIAGTETAIIFGGQAQLKS